MHQDLVPLRGIEELDQLLLDSTHQLVLLFKHSYSCGTSAEALDALIDQISEQEPGVRYAIVAVQTHRDVSNAVTVRLGIRHETPQALLVRNGRVVWSASHFRVTADAVRAAITAHGAVAR
jgi:bacillithiol system protein YtxJ